MKRTLENALYTSKSKYLKPIKAFRGLGCFGDITFQINEFKVMSPKDFSISSKSKITKHNILGAPSISEFKNRELKVVTCSISLFHKVSEINKTIKRFEQMVENGEHHPLILKRPISSNNYILTSFSRDIKKTDFLGEIISVDLKLNFEEYVDDLERGSMLLANQVEVILADQGEVDEANLNIVKKLGALSW